MGPLWAACLALLLLAPSDALVARKTGCIAIGPNGEGCAPPEGLPVHIRVPKSPKAPDPEEDWAPLQRRIRRLEQLTMLSKAKEEEAKEEPKEEPSCPCPKPKKPPCRKKTTTTTTEAPCTTTTTTTTAKPCGCSAGGSSDGSG